MTPAPLCPPPLPALRIFKAAGRLGGFPQDRRGAPLDGERAQARRPRTQSLSLALHLL
jgi:hypothetical protein